MPENFEDLNTVVVSVNSLPVEQQKEFMKSRDGQALLKGASKYGETFSKEHLLSNPAKSTPSKKEATYALAVEIYRKMD